jgi:hypothetical protein
MNGKQAKGLRRELREKFILDKADVPLQYKSDGANYTLKLSGFDKNDQPIFNHDLRNVGTLRRNDKYRQLKRHLQTQLKRAR